MKINIILLSQFFNQKGKFKIWLKNWLKKMTNFEKVRERLKIKNGCNLTRTTTYKITYNFLKIKNPAKIAG